MPLKDPADITTERPDHTQFVDTVRQSKAVSTYETGPNEEVYVFGGFYDDRTAEFPWADTPINPGEQHHLHIISGWEHPDNDDYNLAPGAEITFENPFVVPDGYDFEIVSVYGNMTAGTLASLWGVKPSVRQDPGQTGTTQGDYEPIETDYISGGGYTITNEERVAEPTERSLLDPELEGNQRVATTVEHESITDGPIYGKVYISVVLTNTRDQQA